MSSEHYDQLLTEDEVIVIVTVVAMSAVAAAISVHEYRQAHTLARKLPHLVMCEKYCKCCCFTVHAVGSHKRMATYVCIYTCKYIPNTLCHYLAINLQLVAASDHRIANRADSFAWHESRLVRMPTHTYTPIQHVIL